MFSINQSSVVCTGVEPVYEPDDSGTMDIRVSFTAAIEGEVPDSYREINAIVLAHCDDNLTLLEDLASTHVHSFFKFMLLEVSDVRDSAWKEQVDYIVLVSEDKDQIVFHLDLAFDGTE